MALMIDAKIWFDITSNEPAGVRGLMIDILAAGDLLNGSDIITEAMIQQKVSDQRSVELYWERAIEALETNGLIKIERGLIDSEIVFPDSPVGELREWLEWWNRLHDEGIVPASYRTNKVSTGIRNAWRRVQRSSELMELLARRDEIETQIRNSEFCRERWFCLEKLFGGKNKTGCFILAELLRGAYDTTKANGKRIASEKVFG